MERQRLSRLKYKNMKEILDFYLQLSQNNNKPWFDAHRAEYE
ncbi:MAG: DUF2461 family protein, partial [Bacteroidales bacterium]|nr:DUF2461 family protein [Bacteroidales bacterium]